MDFPFWENTQIADSAKMHPHCLGPHAFCFAVVPLHSSPLHTRTSIHPSIHPSMTTSSSSRSSSTTSSAKESLLPFHSAPCSTSPSSSFSPTAAASSHVRHKMAPLRAHLPLIACGIAIGTIILCFIISQSLKHDTGGLTFVAVWSQPPPRLKTFTVSST